MSNIPKMGQLPTPVQRWSLLEPDSLRFSSWCSWINDWQLWPAKMHQLNLNGISHKRCCKWLAHIWPPTLCPEWRWTIIEHIGTHSRFEIFKPVGSWFSSWSELQPPSFLFFSKSSRGKKTANWPDQAVALHPFLNSHVLRHGNHRNFDSCDLRIHRISDLVGTCQNFLRSCWSFGYINAQESQKRKEQEWNYRWCFSIQDDILKDYIII